MSAGLARAQDAQSQFDKTYGQEAAKLAQSHDAKARAAFAAKLLKDAGQLSDAPDMARLMLEKAYDFGSKDPAGYGTAIEAAKACMSQDPDNKKNLWQDKILTLRQSQYDLAGGSDKSKMGEALVVDLLSFGDNLAGTGNYADAAKLFQKANRLAPTVKSSHAAEALEKLKAVNARLDAEKKLTAYAGKLVANPNDAATAKAATMLCLVQLDSPPQAAKYVGASGDDTLKKFVPMAVQEPEQLAPQDALDTARWFNTLAQTGETATKIPLLTRARNCCQAVLDNDKKQDTLALLADKELDATLKKLAKLSLGGKELLLDLGKGVKLKMAMIPAGQFNMGVLVKHPQTIAKPFYIGITVVTREQFWSLMEKPEADHDRKAASANYPIGNVQWNDAVEFCKRVSKKTGHAVRMPTEAEWEYACRAGSNGAYYFGSDSHDLSQYAWYRDNSDKKVHPVGQKKPNAWGLYDMLGNVWQWVGEMPSQTAKPDPKEKDKGHVTRGGGCRDSEAFCSCSIGPTRPAGFTDDSVGFRIVVEMSK
jgi:formylglycine-generating enzyme required for sulfatase activity